MSKPLLTPTQVAVLNLQLAYLSKEEEEFLTAAAVLVNKTQRGIYSSALAADAAYALDNFCQYACRMATDMQGAVAQRYNTRSRR